MASVLLPILETVTAGARAAYPFIRAGVEAGMSANQIFKSLQDAGLGARRSDVLAIVRSELQGVLARSDFTTYLKDQIPALDRIRTATTKIIAPFSYTLDVTLLDPMTNEQTVIQRTAHSSDPLSPNDAAQTFFDDFAPEATYNGLVITGVTTVDMVKSGAAGVI